jgi:hypothetical protein
MPLIYSFVARETTILAEYTAYTGSMAGGKRTYVADETVVKLQSPRHPACKTCCALVQFLEDNYTTSAQI